MFGWFRKKNAEINDSFLETQSPEVESLPEVEPEPVQDVQAPTLIIPSKSAILLKPLKWVTYQGRIAIVFSLDASGYAVLHFVDADGQTISSERVHAGMLKLARLQEIPAPRRPANAAYAATLGYV